MDCLSLGKMEADSCSWNGRIAVRARNMHRALPGYVPQAARRASGSPAPPFAPSMRACVASPPAASSQAGTTAAPPRGRAGTVKNFDSWKDDRA